MPFSLEQYTGPQQLPSLSLQQRRELAEAIRQEILRIVSEKGGHLASGLGCVELTLALHTVFDLEKDRLFFDTGHQSYPHKILTGRLELLRHLNEPGGACGFPRRDESPYDAFNAGHTGTAISAALGAAVARDRRGGNEKVIALVGDAALGNGTSLEGLNNISVNTKDFLLILNDNKMSIAPNVGALSRFLNHIISAPTYNHARSFFCRLIRAIPLCGEWIFQKISRMDHFLKGLLLHENLFHDLGMRYIGPIDGNNLAQVTSILARIKKLKGNFLLHVYTQKGKGYAPAENDPVAFHGPSPFHLETGTPLRKTDTTFSKTFGYALCRLREMDPDLIAITAGMRDGTGLTEFSRRFPESYFDTGICEGHAVTFAAGLAAAGKHPVCAIYASFIQRAMDHVFHDVCLQNLPVIFALDRAGVTGSGPTHNGILDFAFWQALPNLAVLQPSDATELLPMLELAQQRRQPVILRYPSGNASPLLPAGHSPLLWGKAEVIREGTAALALWCVGRQLALGQKIAEILAEKGVEVTLVNARFTMPFDKELMQRQHDAGMQIAVLEDHVSSTGFGAHCTVKMGFPVRSFGWDAQNPPRWANPRFSPDEIADVLRQEIVRFQKTVI